ncbi:MAG: hypothetical protein DHS80DRAFT_23473 [Piptocephalis tieghemiana]|nr:MAG: hypothetical protein DHS80DRAFT_23473 [Piptocephalis tieghemiana]
MPPLTPDQLHPEALIPWDDVQPYLRVHSIALTILTASFLCGVLLVTSIIHKKRYKSPGQRFPLYLAITDILASGIHLVDHAYNLVHLSVPSPGVCTAIGAFFQFSTYAGLTLTLLMAIHLYLSVKCHVQISWGSHDWKILTIASFTSLLTVIIGLPLNVFGSFTYWCFIDASSKYGVKAASVYYVFIPIFYLVITAIAYALTIRTMRKNAADLRGISQSFMTSSPSSPPTQVAASVPPATSWTSRFDRPRSTIYLGMQRLSIAPEGAQGNENKADRITFRVIRHAASYILAFLITWTPVQVYVTWGNYFSNLHTIPMCGMAFFASMGMVHYLVWSYNERDTRREREWSSRASGHRSQDTSGRGGGGGGPNRHYPPGPLTQSTCTAVDNEETEDKSPMNP